MGKNHNKKRNVGIIFEQLVSYISNAILEKRPHEAKLALEIVRDHFKLDTELYREFRLFNALVKTRVSNSHLASRIISEAKSAAVNHDSFTLRRQKSLLIKDINHKLDDFSFYSQRVKDYRDFATIQTLLNDWRSQDNNTDLRRVATYENIVCERLVSDRDHLLSNNIVNPDDANNLSVRVMTEKFNQKYSPKLSGAQRKLISRYAFGQRGTPPDIDCDDLRFIKTSVLNELREYSECCDNDVLNEKIGKVITNVTKFKVSEINDDSISKALTLLKLSEEILGEDNE